MVAAEGAFPEKQSSAIGLGVLAIGLLADVGQILVGGTSLSVLIASAVTLIIGAGGVVWAWRCRYAVAAAALVGVMVISTAAGSAAATLMSQHAAGSGATPTATRTTVAPTATTSTIDVGSAAPSGPLSADIHCVGVVDCRTNLSRLKVAGMVHGTIPQDGYLQLFVRADTGRWFPDQQVPVEAGGRWAGEVGVGPATVKHDQTHRVCLYLGTPQFHLGLADRIANDPSINPNGMAALPAGGVELACVTATRTP
jgi:hypothetical protein